MKRIYSILVENRPSVLSRVSGLFARRNFNIDSLVVGETDDPEVSCMTIVSSGDKRTIEQIEKQLNKKYEIGPYDLCYCGSGQKYKFCCMKKPKTGLDLIESYSERMKALEDYPYLGNEREENKVYLDDYFSKESIEIDQILYLGLKKRSGYIFNRDERKESNRTKLYLIYAFEKFKEFVDKECISSFVEYDSKYSIHYMCEAWINALLDIIKKDANYKELTKQVKKYKKNMLE